MATYDTNSFWDEIVSLRRNNLIPRDWKRSDIRPFLSKKGYKQNSITTIPSNQSISQNGTVQGNYVQRGMEPKAYRLGNGYYRLIVDPEN